MKLKKILSLVLAMGCLTTLSASLTSEAAKVYIANPFGKKKCLEDRRKTKVIRDKKCDQEKEGVLCLKKKIWDEFLKKGWAPAPRDGMVGAFRIYCNSIIKYPDDDDHKKCVEEVFGSPNDVMDINEMMCCFKDLSDKVYKEKLKEFGF